MRRQRLPTTGLVSLVVVLLALAVVVVAGIPAPSARVEIRWHRVKIRVLVVHRSMPPRATTSRRSGASGVVLPSGSRRGGAVRRAVAPRRRGGALTATSTSTSTTTTTPTTTTTTLPATTTTTVPPGAPTSREGVFEGGDVVATKDVGAVRTVTVAVAAGVPVSLKVVCGLAAWSATSLQTTTVHVLSGGASCTATFSIPSTSPQPARWRLTTA